MALRRARRGFLASAGAALISVPELHPFLARQAKRATPQVRGEWANLKALVFDTFGTIVDWRSWAIAEGMAWGKAKGLKIDWAQFAERWRLGYRHAMAKLRNGEIPSARLDHLHRMILEDLLT